MRVEVPCEHCDGTGLVECSQCKGQKKPERVCSYCLDWGTIDCPACMGRGYVMEYREDR